MSNNVNRGATPGSGAGGKPTRHRWRLWAGVGIALAAVGTGGGFIGAAMASSGTASTASSSEASQSAASCAVTNVADQILPSVVTIAAKGPAGSGTGSGEVIKSDGYILTNNHVISPAAADGGSVEVLLSDGSAVPAAITGRDPLTDLAVLKVQPSHQLKPIAFGSSGSVRVGQPVAAAGAPLGLSGTVTSGIVSALDRTVQVPGENDTAALLVSAVQTDAAINPGNSGGALVNCQGQLIGVPTAGASVPSSSGESAGGNIGLGFAIPVNLAKTISNEIITTGRVTHAYFGLQTIPIPADVAAQAGAPQGLYVAGTAAGGPAAHAGLRTGDVITKIGDQPATSNVQLQELTLTKKPGDQVAISFARDGKPATTTVTLGTQP